MRRTSSGWPAPELSPPGVVHIEQGGDGDGRSTFTPSPTGNVRVVQALDASAVVEAMITGIVDAGSG